MLLNLVFNNVRRGVGVKFKSGLISNRPPKVFKLSVLSHLCDDRSTICGFHTSSPRNALPPVLVFLLRYAVKFGAMLSGRAIRKWWGKLTPEEKVKVWRSIQNKKSKIAFGVTIFIGGGFFYYLEHIVEDPITKRKKFIMLSQKQMNQIGEFETFQQMQLFKTAIVPTYHPMHRRVERVTTNLLVANLDLKGIKDKNWSVTVIDRPDITNALALPNGKIFVFTGMLNVCTNDDQLAVVLAHEMAHSILSHVAESMSRIFLMDFILLIPTFFFWMIFPDVWAIFSEWITSSLTKLLIHLPFSRSIEKEADVVGLQLAARSCYDVREAPIFWGKMKYIHQDYPAEWLSTHPSHESRQLDLKEMLPQALHTRELNNCPPLKYKLFLY